ncbi:hypothetical protein Rcae01_02091 [Novipirellula caenicola]|uniref:Uncharacterized protein n=1 Tax=Novipirellula caenicola TaxID=1536901 RepID=A0ABP9VN65_9BACT
MWDRLPSLSSHTNFFVAKLAKSFGYSQGGRKSSRLSLLGTSDRLEAYPTL